MTAAPAQVLSKKSKLLEKSKLKKITKNILCKPDQDFWPTLSEEQSLQVAKLMSEHKIDIPEFTKLPWPTLKDIPKDQRPKQKRAQNVPGFYFGMSSCVRLIKDEKCKCLLVDNEINPRILVSHIVQMAVDNKIPIVCVKSLKKITTTYFGFPSACVALDNKQECTKLKEKISQFWETISSMDEAVKNKDNKIMLSKDDNEENVNKKMEIDELVEKKKPFEYLTRTSNKYRAFVPPDSEEQDKVCKEFTGQNYIKLNNDAKKENKLSYKGMVVKRFSGNANRKKSNKKNKK